jgi:hypothetical protein
VTQTSSLNISGSGFYPSGSANIVITTNKNDTTSYAISSDSTGSIADTISVSSITGVTSASSLTVMAQDVKRNINSNSIVIQIQDTHLIGGVTQTQYVGVSDTSSAMLPNTGVRAKIQVVPMTLSNGDTVSAWISEETANGMWAQVGYYIVGPSPAPTGFYQIWNMNNGTVAKSGVLAVTAGNHVFSMYLKTGTVWGFSIDASEFGAYDMLSGISIGPGAYPIVSTFEMQLPLQTAVSTVNFPTAIEVYKSGTWIPAPNGVTSQSISYMMGIQGNIQNPSISKNAFVVNADLPALSPNTKLW